MAAPSPTTCLSQGFTFDPAMAGLQIVENQRGRSVIIADNVRMHQVLKQSRKWPGWQRRVFEPVTYPDGTREVREEMRLLPVLDDPCFGYVTHLGAREYPGAVLDRIEIQARDWWLARARGEQRTIDDVTARAVLAKAQAVYLSCDAREKRWAVRDVMSGALLRVAQDRGAMHYQALELTARALRFPALIPVEPTTSAPRPSEVAKPEQAKPEQAEGPRMLGDWL